MHNRLSSGSSYLDWPVYCGDYDGQRPSRLVYSKSRRTILATSERRTKSRRPPAALFNANSDRRAASYGVANAIEIRSASDLASAQGRIAPDVELARCFVRLCNLPNYALDRLSRYEAMLWRQAGQILLALENLDRRKPQERIRRFHLGSEQASLGVGREER